MTIIKTINPTVLYEYSNGGYCVKIFSDGTKHRTKLSNDPTQYPESIDLKITNKCDLSDICTFCHEQSRSMGKHADLTKVLRQLEGLPKGVELAIGGGNPLTHPHLKSFLQSIKHMGLIANITVNQRHTGAHKDLLIDLMDNNLVHGVGVSRSGNKSFAWVHDHSDNIVHHLIMGVNDIDELTFINKALILGFKDKGKGISYSLYEDGYTDCVNKWKNNIHKWLGNRHLSFDNLALQQLNIKRHLSPDTWNKMFMGDDGDFTFYMDTVENRFSKSSNERDTFMSISSNCTAIDMFKIINKQPQKEVINE